LLSLRVFDSSGFRDQLRETLDLGIDDTIVAQNVLSPRAEGLLSIGSGFDQRYYRLPIPAGGKLEPKLLDTGGAQLLTNRVIP